MYYKVSNTASRSIIENELGVNFKYPRLHEPNSVINGMDEELIGVITEENPNMVDFAIWGMLPTHYTGEWSTYQQLENTLNTPLEHTYGNTLPFKGLHFKRCLVVVTGYFVSHLHQGELYPYYVHLPNKQPFYMGGIYTTLNDGFLTTSLLIGKGSNGISPKIQNLGEIAPLIVPKEHANNWLENKFQVSDMERLLAYNQQPKFTAYPIAKEFYYRNIKYKSMLDPVFYETLPLSYS
ncbi:SOS response-associated peptidase family protein [Sediminicola sp. 1XM1-17]|uniref:SOS response-associated peptidase family protein n=1 Tax=Sediminicola sp. 1XM1-17 TaxID=3127702 RepID=UPI0030786E8C